MAGAEQVLEPDQPREAADQDAENRGALDEDVEVMEEEAAAADMGFHEEAAQPEEPNVVASHGQGYEATRYPGHGHCQRISRHRGRKRSSAAPCT